MQHQPYHLIQSNGEPIPIGLAKELTTLALEIYEGEQYEAEKETYHGSMGNFFAKK